MINQNIHPAEIKAALQKQGVSQRQLAKTLGVSTTTISLVINGLATSKRVAEAISEKTGLEIEYMWPDRYSSINPN